MPRQNRVTPFGEIVGTPEGGTFMGNRGVLHDSGGHIKRAWQVKRWLVCVLDFRGRHRTVMTAGSYTELFFLDEATALAAGHRPCAECRHSRFVDFCNSWKTTYPTDGGSQRPTAAQIDDRLHRERLTTDGTKRTYKAVLGDLPNGVLVTLNNSRAAYLVWGDKFYAWSAGGYQKRRPRPRGKTVTVLTPASTVKVIRSGYIPGIHVSAGL